MTAKATCCSPTTQLRPTLSVVRYHKRMGHCGWMRTPKPLMRILTAPMKALKLQVTVIMAAPVMVQVVVKVLVAEHPLAPPVCQ